MGKQKPWTRKQRHIIQAVEQRRRAERERMQRAWERYDRQAAQAVNDMLRGVRDA